MDVFSCIATRHSTRKFKEEPVPQELLEKVIEAGRGCGSTEGAFSRNRANICYYV